ncbi:hypothetical protein Glove_67g129 [Diversispora epigaea]|uniref:Protein kinase domain-containing protein n=1 Tax=Diversispora epigaea TaxID=1348612 RepID=A0A397JA87_9GLOM|nr:hypothetical protein Glove_67g129 [Diversispora epigaea]
MTTQEIKWNEKLKSIWGKTFYSLDPNIHKTLTEEEEHRRTMFENDSSLTENEKNFLLYQLKQTYDEFRIDNNSVEKQKCNNCQNWHQATQYCEFCIRKYLENNFGNWTSGNNEINKLIQECQQKTVVPHKVIEWIEYDRIENVEHLAEGGYATIYTAFWKDGGYEEWNSKSQILERFGRQRIALKRLNDSNSNNVHWFQEVTLSFTLDKTSAFLVNCYGLTKDPSTQDYMLVLNYYDTNLKQFLKDNYQSLTLLKKYSIIYDITNSLCEIHYHNITHRDLHSGNFLYDSRNNIWYISDLGFSGPVDKQLDSIYGNLPYVAPEILCKKDYTKNSDVYSLGIIMWEVITGETPFIDHEFNSDSYLVLAIINGYRPKIYKHIPDEYVTLMKQCWDANPDNRPDAETIRNKIGSLILSLYNNEMDNQEPTIQSNSSKSKFSPSSLTKIESSQKIQTSEVYAFDISVQSRNATEAYETKQFDFVIPEEFEKLSLNNVDDSNNLEDDAEIRKLWSESIYNRDRQQPFDDDDEFYDFIIVGAGTAGCVLARELICSIPNINILVLEAGPPDTHINDIMRSPCAYATVSRTNETDWGYSTEDQKMPGTVDSNEEVFPLARGKVIGGCSTVNAMAYMRGHKDDYNRWAAQGPEYIIWNYDHCLEAFKAVENNARKNPDEYFKNYHGFNGLLHVQDSPVDKFDISKDVFKGVKDFRIPYNNDFNGVRQNGVGEYQFTMKDGKRFSLADGFLKDALKRVKIYPPKPFIKGHPHKLGDVGKFVAVNVKSFTHMLNIIWDERNEDKNIAKGVRYYYNGRKYNSFIAPKGEVIICGGAINSSQILMLMLMLSSPISNFHATFLTKM